MKDWINKHGRVCAGLLGVLTAGPFVVNQQIIGGALAGTAVVLVSLYGLQQRTSLSREQNGGVPAPIVLGTIGSQRPSTANAMVMQMPPEERELTTKLFAGDQSRIQKLFDATQAEGPVVKSAGNSEN